MKTAQEIFDEASAAKTSAASADANAASAAVAAASAITSANAANTSAQAATTAANNATTAANNATTAAQPSETAALAAQDPRTPISSVPFSISSEGSYYLTQSLSGFGDGISINADNVTLDLNGFSLRSNNTGAGISLNNEPNSVRVRNGIVDNFGVGVRIDGGESILIEDLMIYDSGTSGIEMVGLSESLKGLRIQNCLINDNFGHGIHLLTITGSIESVEILNCQMSVARDDAIYVSGSGVVVRDNRVTGFLGTGIYCVGDNGLIQYNFLFANPLNINDHGVQTLGDGNVVIGNTVISGLSSPYSLSADGINGPIYSGTGTIPSSGAGVHPWANFSYTIAP